MCSGRSESSGESNSAANQSPPVKESIQQQDHHANNDRDAGKGEMVHFSIVESQVGSPCFNSERA
jgi:hypothetical protein